MSYEPDLDHSMLGVLGRRLERAALRRRLAARSDRELADMGFSRALLNDGVAAWPWRLTEEETGLARADINRAGGSARASRRHPANAGATASLSEAA